MRKLLNAQTQKYNTHCIKKSGVTTLAEIFSEGRGEMFKLRRLPITASQHQGFSRQ